MLETFTKATFADKVGDTFRVEVAPDHTVDTQLVDVRSLTDETAGGAVRPTTRPPFAVTFLGPETPLLPQRMYAIAHDTLGVQTIFIVPIGRRGGGVLYEAVFT